MVEIKQDKMSRWRQVKWTGTEAFNGSHKRVLSNQRTTENKVSLLLLQTPVRIEDIHISFQSNYSDR